MSEFVLTAVEGLKAQDDVWEGFYGEEDEKQLKKSKGLAETQKQGIWDDFYSEEDAKQQKKSEDNVAETKPENDSYDDDFEADKEKDKTESSTQQEGIHAVVTEDNSRTETPEEKDSPPDKRIKKKGRGRKSKVPAKRSSSASQRADHSKSRISRERSPPNHHTHNQENNRPRGRKLNRRRQMKNEYSLELSVEQSGQDRLEQKYMELEDLMTRPLADKKGHTSPRRLHRLMYMQRHHARVGYEEGGTGYEEGEGNDHDAYSTIRTLQTTQPNLRLHISYDRQLHSPRSKHSPQSGLPPKPSTPQRESRGSVDSPVSSSSGRSESRNETGHSWKEKAFGGYSSEEEDSDEDTSYRRVYVPTDMHLKHTDNPKLREWLKRKDAEYRKARKAERIKRREERNDKMVEAELKIARREKSADRVKKWMEVKRKEAVLRQKVERQRRKQEAEEQNKRARSQENGVRGTRIDRPRTAPTQKSSYRLIKRPNSAARLDEGHGSNSKPPDTKFVYKRSVTGRVQLMKFQNERNARARNADQQRCDGLSAEERQEKARTSYEAWLLAKKKQAVENKKAAKRQKELAQSDPEMERIIPEMARRRIERVTNRKKSLDTGLHQPSASSGGEEGETQEEVGQENSEPRRPSYQLAVNGVAASVVTPNTRPVSARTRTPVPHKASSPQRPKSASATSSSKRKVKAIADTPENSESSSYKLPFPDELGAPYHVKRVQERIFSKELTSKSDDGERPEPQGCAAVESAACPQGVDSSPKSDTTSQNNMVLLQEIEAAAIQSEQEAAVMAVQNALERAASSASKNISNAGAEEVSQESKKPDEEPVEESTQEQDGPAVDEPEENAEEEEQVEQEIKESEDAAEDNEEQMNEDNEADADDTELQHKEEEEKNEASDDDDNPKEEEPTEEEEQVAAELEQKEDRAEQISEEAVDQETAELSSITAEEQVTETALENKEEPEEQTEEQTASQPEPSEDNETEPQDTQGNEDAEQETEFELDSSLRRSDKHVSFSEDLTTVFESASAAASSSFEDEPGHMNDTENRE